jgi:hypothetical protein
MLRWGNLRWITKKSDAVAEHHGVSEEKPAVEGNSRSTVPIWRPVTSSSCWASPTAEATDPVRWWILAEDGRPCTAQGTYSWEAWQDNRQRHERAMQDTTAAKNKRTFNKTVRQTFLFSWKPKAHYNVHKKTMASCPRPDISSCFFLSW